MMGAVPSSAVQQTAYLEALDQYIDYDEDDNLRKCLLDSNGERIKDKEGNPKTLRHRFAIYCDDIAAGADTLKELYELLEALICCCNRAGIQIKAGKLKFGLGSQKWCFIITPYQRKGLNLKRLTSVHLSTCKNRKTSIN